ncbi:MAG: hypothetical protein OXC14_08165 [Rhodospirillaceae bacterium]|nr:hypothetical protein [Rhodospirillaceae bacterium]
MTTNATPKPSLDEVLTEIAALPAPPDAQQLRRWTSQHPEFTAEIVDFATDWVEMDAAEDVPEATQDEVNRIVNRTMSRVQQLLDEAERSDSMQDLGVEIKAAGHDLDSFQRAVGIDRSILTCLMERMVKPAGIPLLLVQALAEALNRSVEQIRTYLVLPPQPSAAYRSRSQPVSNQADFSELVEHAELSDSDKARWLAEPPDPALRD